MLLYGAVAVGAVLLYNRYAKKPTPQGEEPQGGGGGGGIGGGTIVIPALPAPSPAVTIQNILPAKPMTSSVSLPTQVSAPSSSTSAGAMSGVGVSNTGGIVPISQGGSVTPQYSTGSVSASQMSTGLSGGAVFKPFDGDMGGLRLENLVRSWNRP